MKTIVLHAPAHDNANAFRDSGAEITIGSAGDMITAERAASLISGLLAVAGKVDDKAPGKP